MNDDIRAENMDKILNEILNESCNPIADQSLETGKELSENRQDNPIVQQQDDWSNIMGDIITEPGVVPGADITEDLTFAVTKHQEPNLSHISNDQYPQTIRTNQVDENQPNIFDNYKRTDVCGYCGTVKPITHLKSKKCSNCNRAMCMYPDCTIAYAWNQSATNHCRNKHPGFQGIKPIASHCICGYPNDRTHNESYVC